MDINRYVTGVHLSNEGLKITLLDGSEHLISDNNALSKLAFHEYIKQNFKQFETKTFEGWLGGDYGLYNTQKDANRGHLGGEYITDLIEEFKGKKISVQITEIE